MVDSETLATLYLSFDSFLAVWAEIQRMYIECCSA